MLLRRTLDALAHQTLPVERYEVIVSIDGSEDGTREMLYEFAAPYRLVARWQPNRGRAAARNVGIHAAQGKLIVLLDDDMEPIPTFLEAHLRAHLATTSVGVIGAAPIIVTPTSSAVTCYIATKFNAHLERLGRLNHELALRDFYVGNFSVHRHDLLAIGGFDESFTLYGNEDLELLLRLRLRGVRIIYAASAIAQQHYTKSFAQLANDTMEKGRTAVQLARKNPEALTQLELSRYWSASFRWRVLRSTLLKLATIWKRTPDAMVRFVEWLERRRTRSLSSMYGRALDYFYWLGVFSSVRDHQLRLPRPATSKITCWIK